MDTFNKGKLKKIKPAKTFNYKLKCKTCKDVAIYSLDSNILIKKGRIKLNETEEKVEKIYVFFDLIPRTKAYTRNLFKVVDIYYLVCPNCGNEKPLFYSETRENIIEKGEWFEDIYYYNCVF